MYFRRGRVPEALATFDALLHYEPSSVDALLWRGQCLDRLDRIAEAEASYDRALAIDPGNTAAYGYRARMRHAVGRTEEAVEDWHKVCALDPADGKAWRELIYLLAATERETEALAALDAAEAALGTAPAACIDLGRAAEAAMFDERAVAFFGRAIAAEPRNASHLAAFGAYYHRQGVIDGAYHTLLDSRELDPRQLDVAKNLVEIVHALNAIGIDHVALRRGPRTSGEILFPERLFAQVRRIADDRVVAYEPVPGRVAVMSSSLAPGGAERQLVNMLSGMRDPAYGLDLSLFCLSLASRSRRDFFRPLLEGTGIEIVVPDAAAAEKYLRDPAVAPYADAIRRFPEDMTVPIAFWLKQFRERRPEIVHAWQDQINLAAAVAGLLAGVPRIVLSTRSVRPDNPRRRLKRFMREAYRAVLGHPAVVLTNNSRAGAEDYADWLGIDPARVAVVHNGIDFEKLARSVDRDEARRERQGLGIPDGAPILGSVFRMSEEKRPLLWLDVAAEVARAKPDAHFVICGDGPMRDEMLEHAARRGIRERLHLAGSRPNIATWYSMMDLVMLTSRHEGLPNVLLEAQGLGIPVVAPDVGGMSETVWQGVTGWTIHDADAGNLAERVLFCLDNDPWRKAAHEKAPGFVRDRFGMAAMVRRNLEVYGLAPAAASGAP
jgi:glycosyltransferase involved in cell wall biosynthesis/Tfp pilus assembly protein PilF